MKGIDYDRVAERFDEDWSGLYATARARAISQICTQLYSTKRALDAVDFGIGTGNAFCQLNQRVNLGRCTGFDLSQGMLERARIKLDGRVRLIHDDATSAIDYLPAGSQDLVLAHFILGFCDAEALLESAFASLRPGGYLSLAASTRGSMPELHRGRFSRVSRLLGINRSQQKSSNPADLHDCREKVEACGFEVVSAQLHRQAVCYRSFRDVRAWAVDSGWLVNANDAHLAWRIAAGRVVFALARIFMYPLYPIHATSEMSIVLAQKPEPVRENRLPARRRAGSRGAKAEAFA